MLQKKAHQEFSTIQLLWATHCKRHSGLKKLWWKDTPSCRLPGPAPLHFLHLWVKRTGKIFPSKAVSLNPGFSPTLSFLWQFSFLSHITWTVKMHNYHVGFIVECLLSTSFLQSAYLSWQPLPHVSPCWRWLGSKHPEHPLPSSNCTHLFFCF